MSTATAELSLSFHPSTTPSFVNTTTNFARHEYIGPEKIFLDPENTRDINEYYNVENELDFLDRYGSRLNQEEQFFYLVENQLKFLGEFVGNLKFNKVRYLLNERNGFNFAGLRMIHMLKHTTTLAGNNSREGFENTGLVELFKKFEKDLLNGDNKMQNGLLISPPKDWNYGFAFFYEKVYDPFLDDFVVNMYSLRYAEEGHQLTQSQKLLASLKTDTSGYQTTADYLMKPLLDDIPSLDRMLSLTAITTEDVRKSEEFQILMEEQLGAEIVLYSRGVISLHQRKNFMSVTDFTREYSFLEKLRRSIFNQAKKIWAQKPEITYDAERFGPTSSHTIADKLALSNSPPMIDMRRMNYFADQGPAVIVGGGSCPVVKRSTSNLELTSGLQNGNSIESILAKNSLGISGSEESDEFGPLKFDCPDCKKTNVRAPHELLPACQHCGSDKVCAPTK